MNTLFQWHVVYTKAGCEQKVAEALTRKRIDNYCPLYTLDKEGNNRKKTAEVPLFTSFVFARINASQHSEIKKVNNVLNLVYWRDKPAIINEQEIVSIRSFLKDYKQVKLTKTAVAPYEKARFLQNSLIFDESRAPEKQQDEFKLVLPSLGYMLVAQAEKASVELIKTAVRKAKMPQFVFDHYKLSLD